MREPYRRTDRVELADLDAIVFDLDGVLIDTWKLYLNVYRQVYSELLGDELSDEQLIALARTSESGTLNAALPFHLIAPAIERFKHWYVVMSEEFTVPFRPALRAVTAAHERGLRVGVFTGKMRATAEHELARFGLSRCLDYLCSEDDFPEPKPHSGGLVQLMDALKLTPRRTLYVGDQRNDLLAGRGAGALTGAALWARYTSIEPARDVPDIVFPTPDSCLEFVDPSRSTKRPC